MWWLKIQENITLFEQINLNHGWERKQLLHVKLLPNQYQSGHINRTLSYKVNGSFAKHSRWKTRRGIDKFPSDYIPRCKRIQFRIEWQFASSALERLKIATSSLSLYSVTDITLKLRFRMIKPTTCVNWPSLYLVSLLDLQGVQWRLDWLDQSGVSLTANIWNLQGFCIQDTKFHNSRARSSWKQAIIYGQIQDRSFKGKPWIWHEWIDGFPDQMAILLYMGIVIQFLAEPWRFQMNDYFGITHSLVVWIHPNGLV